MRPLEQRSPAPSVNELDTLLAEGSPRRDSANLDRGSNLGRYVVLDRVGAGGMGEVFAAYDPELDRKVAIKLLHSQRSGDPEHSDGAARLLREAQALARLSHPNVITVFDVGTLGERVFVAMEFVEGTTLKDWMDDGHHAVDAVLTKFIPAGRGLQAAHEAGLVHRDFKPENVLLGRDGRVLVADFGLAFAADTEVTEGPKAPPRELDAELISTGTSQHSLSSRLTIPGAIMGTPAYMAPEQHLGGTVDARTDQFSYCVALHEALYGERPFRGDSLAALALQVTQGNMVTPVKASAVPNWLRRIVSRGLERKPGDRHASMADLLVEIDRGRQRKRNRWTMAIAGTIVAAFLGLVLAPGRDASAVCATDDAARERDEVWSDGHRSTVQDVFEASGSAWADKAWQTLEPALDRYMDDWQEMRVDACRATHERGEQSEHLLDLRMQCLATRKQAAADLVDVLSSADEEVLERSTDLVFGLPRIERCADTEALTARVPPPEDEQTRAGVTELRSAIDRASTLLAANKVTQARAIADESAARAAELDYPPIQAEAYILRAQATMGEDEAAAEKDLIAAAAAAISSGDDLSLARAAKELIRLVSERQHRWDDADLWYAIAEAALVRLEGEAELDGRVQMLYAQSLSTRGEGARARGMYEDLLEFYTGVSGPESTDVADVYRGLAAVAFHERKIEEMAELTGKSLDILRMHHGDDHPKLGAALNNLAIANLERGEYREAADLFQRLADLRERNMGPDDISTVDAKSNLGLTLTYLDEHDRAVVLLAEVARVYEERYGLENRGTGEALANLANAYEVLGKYDEAHIQLERALETFRAVEGERSRTVGMLLASQGALAGRRGDHERALQLCSQAHEIVLEAEGINGPYAHEVAIDLGQAQVFAGRHGDAVRLIEPLLPEIRANEPPEKLAEALFVLAQAKGGSKSGREDARALSDEALVVLPGGQGRTEELRARIDAWRAKTFGTSTPGRGDR